MSEKDISKMGMLSQLVFITLIGVTISQSCMPTNWNYAWVKVGKAWFTHLKVPRTWLEQVCEVKSSKTFLWNKNLANKIFIDISIKNETNNFHKGVLSLTICFHNSENFDGFK